MRLLKITVSKIVAEHLANKSFQLMTSDTMFPVYLTVIQHYYFVGNFCKFSFWLFHTILQCR